VTITRTRRRGVPVVLALTLGFTLASGVASAHAQAGQAPSRSAPATSPAILTWPPPPAQARIQFVRTLDPAAVRGKPSILSKVWKAFVGAGDEPRMLRPYGIAVGPDRKVYVADTFGRAIHVYDLAKPGYSSVRVDGQSLIGVAYSGGLLFVTDSATSRLLCLDTKGHTRWTLGRKDGFERPTGLVVAGDRLHVVDSLRNRVVAVSLAGAVIDTLGEPGNGPGQFNYPTNIARSTDGRLFVTDTMNFRVQVFSEDGRYLRTFGRLGDGSGDFDKPKGIAVDSAGHVYVVEGVNDVVQVFDGSGAFLLAFGGSGSGEGQLWLPSGIAIVNDVVYVADSANRRVQVFRYLRSGQ
jgi:DNA-binding beta-propeller fold protein YncE